jgi:hypothetical protein
LSRWAALNLCGNYRILNETETFRIRRKPIHATTPLRHQLLGITPVRIDELKPWNFDKQA